MPKTSPRDVALGFLDWRCTGGADPRVAPDGLFFEATGDQPIAEGRAADIEALEPLDGALVECVGQGERVGFTFETLDPITGLRYAGQWVLTVRDGRIVRVVGRWCLAAEVEWLTGADLAARAAGWLRAADLARIEAAEAIRRERRALAAWLALRGMALGVAPEAADAYAGALAALDAAVGLDAGGLGEPEDAVRGPGWWCVPLIRIGCVGYLVFDDGGCVALGSGLDLRVWLWALSVGFDLAHEGRWWVRVGDAPPVSLSWLDLRSLMARVEADGSAIEVWPDTP